MAHQVDQSTRRLLKLLAGGTVAAIAGGCSTSNPSQPPEAGFEYRAGSGLWPHRTPGKIEVAEFFWYACPFCNAFEPALKDWFARQSSDIVLRKVHPSPNAGWRPYSQLFYSLVAMGRETELSPRVYAAIHQQKRRLKVRQDLLSLIEEFGLEPEAFLRIFDAYQVKTAMDQANEMAKFFKLDGVPALVVNGRWYTSPAMAGSRERTLQVVDFLIEHERRRA